ncbi:MAG: NFACT family protein [Clostridia bacterium]|nr:NFACT family protein [Clostridia bacterium]
MALDGITLHFITEELKEKILLSKVEKIYQPSKCELVFLMRTRAGAFRLYMSAQAISPRIQLTAFTPENPQKPPMLCMLFRKRLTGAVLEEIEQFSLDRVLRLKFNCTNEIGDRQTLFLYIEIMAQRSNIVLTDAEDIIIDAVKRVDETKSTYREILPGLKYLLPPSQGKLDITTSSEDELVEAVLSHGSKKLSAAVLNSVTGVSPIVARELAYRSCGDDIQTDLITPDGRQRLSECFSLVKNIIINGEALPCAVFDSDRKPVDFSFFDITQYGDALSKKQFDSFSELLDEFCFEKDRLLRIKNRAGDLLKLLSNTRERILRKINLQKAQLEKCADKEQLRICAELIGSNLYRLEKGAAFYDLENYYDGGKMLRISANPALTPVQNSQKYYKDYRKAVTAEKMLDDLIDSAEQELSYIDSVLDSLSRADTEAEISEIRQELIGAGYLRSRSKDKIKLPKTLPPYEFTTSDGFKVLVGRNNFQNDKLTFKTAKNYDMWLHTQSFAGSHTIIVSDNREITDTAIFEAARIAAGFSSASEAYKVPVDYTLVKNLKKPPNSRPGKVIYHVYNTIYVEPLKREREQK